MAGVVVWDAVRTDRAGSGTPSAARSWGVVRPSGIARSSGCARVSGAGVIGVVGARGGVGASTFAAALAHRLSRRSTAVLVDLERAGGGIDVVVGLEESGGIRWPDLVDARGAIDARELAALLPCWGSCAVLSADRTRPGAPPHGALMDVLTALGAQHDTVVLDLDRCDVLDRGAALASCRVVLVVVPRDLRAVAGALALRPALVELVPDVRLVVRGPAPGGLGALELAHVVDLPLAVSMPWDRRLAADGERGGGPVARRGALGRAVARVAGALA
jgi:secretion/DNA translocation related CpaE-like protein